MRRRSQKQLKDLMAERAACFRESSASKISEGEPSLAGVSQDVLQKYKPGQTPQNSIIAPCQIFHRNIQSPALEYSYPPLSLYSNLIMDQFSRYHSFIMKVQTQTVIEHKSTTKPGVVYSYVKGKQLGKGGFAKCYELTDTNTGKLLAAKIVEKATLTRSKAKEKLVSQIQIHRSISHQHIVGFETSFEDADCVYIIMELCSNQTLNQLLRRRKRLTEIEAQCYLFQIASALDYLHRNKIIHRDLKLSNLFLSDRMQIKVGDLGLAAKLSSNYQRRKTVCGTPNYIAPQILDGLGHSYEVDLWSYGVIAYALMVGRLPFQNKENNMNITYNKIRMCNYSFPQQVSLSKAAKNFINKLLQLDPLKRMTIEEVFTHDFLTINPFPRTLPLSTLAQPPSCHFVKQFLNINTQSNQQSQKQGARRNSSSDRNICLQARMSAVDILRAPKDALPKIESKIPRPASTAILSKWKYLERKQQNLLPPIQNKKQLGNEIEQWVCNHIESSKYGTCYTLNSGAVGMFFIDNTCLIADAAFTKLKYLGLSKHDETRPLIFDVGNHDPSLAKKVKILQHFKAELSKQKQAAERKIPSQQLIKLTKTRFRKQTKQTCMNIFVKKCGSKNSFRYFLFNNNLLQGIFKDGTQMLISPMNNLYINKYGEQKVFLTGDGLCEQVGKKYQFLVGLLKNYRPNKSAGRGKENENSNVVSKFNSVLRKQSSTSTNDSKQNEVCNRKLVMPPLTDRPYRS